MKFIGIDLAWSPKNNSGICVLKGDERSAEVEYAKLVVDDEEIVGALGDIGEESAFIAIDAPLIVPNTEGRRKAEEITGKLFRKYNAGAHPSNRKRLGEWNNGKVRGEEITRKITEKGFEHNPEIEKFEDARKVFEVYPHPSMVVLFNLGKIIPYKSKPNRNEKQRNDGFRLYQERLKGLKNANPRLIVDEEMLSKDIKNMKQKEIKEYEDKLDAIFCAYIAYYAWHFPEKCAVLGNMNEGYILTPVFEYMKEQLKDLEGQKKLEF